MYMQVADVLNHNVENVLPDKSSLEKLMSTKKIRVYFGVDPTGPKLHLGHSIPLRKLQQFADLGHEAILLFGTGTVLAGDPSQRQEARKPITAVKIEENIKDWKRQASKIIDFDKVQIKENGTWLSKLSIPEIINIASNISAMQLFKRDMFQQRIKKGDTIWTHELLYPILQGYDSVFLDVDLEIGGTDQTFNMLIGRELQKKIKSREKYVLTTPMISGTNGEQMSKSSANCIWLDDTPDEMYGKIMSTADTQIEPYWTLLTNLDKTKLKNLKPLDAKKELAHEIVKMYHSQNDANTAQQNFENTVQKGQTPKDLEVTQVESGITIGELVADQTGSNSESKRLLSQQAVEVDGQIITDFKTVLQSGQVIKIGKKKFLRIK
jgi:tyrosyl-tRNA synthetase